jgi:V/A-type H+-transporting ATPase subunit K
MVQRFLAGVTRAIISLGVSFLWPAAAWAADAGPLTDPGVVRWAFISAAIAAGAGALGAGLAVATVGAAALGAISEKPELAGRALIFVGLAEGIAIYGLIVAIMILGRV